MSFILKSVLALLLVAIIAFTSFVAVKGSHPVGVVGVDPAGSTAVLNELNYWDFMANRLAANRQSPTNCLRTRLIVLTACLPVYPALYTYVALYPESALARHTQPSPLIPDPITWAQVPGNW